VSIITPCRNGAAFLPRALESVVRSAAEAGRGWVEHIIIDGGSTDGSAELIRRHAAANPNLVSYWRSQPDSGQSEAINHGMSVARGRYATWLNADDWYEPPGRGGLAAMVARLRDAAADAVVGRCRFVDQKGKVVWEPRPPQPISLANLLSLRSVWFAGQSLVQPEVFFKLELFRRLGGLNQRNHYTMDHELWCRMLLAGAKFEQMEILVANAGVHPGQKTQDNREVVRAMLTYAIPMAAQHAARLGSRAAQVNAELRAMSCRLHVVDEVFRWWDRALAMRDSERRALAFDDQPSPPPAGDAVRAKAMAAAARVFRWRREVRIALYETDAHVAALAARALGKRRAIEMHLASSSRLTVSQASAAAKPLLSSRSSIVTHRGPLVAGPFDMIVVQGISSRIDAPASQLAGLWSRLAPGGVLVQLDDPVFSEDLRRHVELLRARMSENLSKNDDVVLDPRADAVLRRIAGYPRPPIPGAIMLREIVPRLSCDAVCRFEKCFGGAQDHPLTPFAVSVAKHAADFGSWCSSVWRKARV
jgi:glycosyltransferase involved in cell wall biosynthesis